MRSGWAHDSVAVLNQQRSIATRLVLIRHQVHVEDFDENNFVDEDANLDFSDIVNSRSSEVKKVVTAF